jgi:para-aminobenzoate synthetase component II
MPAFKGPGIPRNQRSGFPVIVVIDNHDSFTFNLVQYLAELGADVRVLRSDEATAGDVKSLLPSGVLFGPGPGVPEEAGITMDLLARLAGRVPILGVCLGHQAIGRWLGVPLVRARRPVHGRTSPVAHDGTGLFEELPSPFAAARYHSLVLDAARIPDDLVVHAWSEGEVMGIRHRHLPIEGLQFHPESFLTEHGHRMLGTWLARLGRSPHQRAA